MKNIIENIKTLSDEINAVKKHCLCLNFEESKNHFLVTYPAGFEFDGVRIDKNMGKIKALVLLRQTMEKHWLTSFIS